MTSEQIAEVERLVNQWIGEAHNLVVAEMPLDEAKDKGAVAMFGER